MAKRKSYKQDFRASVQGNLSPKREQIEKRKASLISANNGQISIKGNMAQKRVNDARSIEALVNKKFEQAAKDVESSKSNAWIDRLKIKKTSAQNKQDLYQDMTKMLYPQHFKSKLLNPNTPNEVVNKLVASLYELYKEQLPNIRYVALNRVRLDKMFKDYQFSKAWESDVFETLATEYTTKELNDEELLKYITNLSKFRQASLYNLLYSYKAMPTGHYKGIQELAAKLGANRKAILAGTIYENAPREEQDKYVSAFYRTFREWARSLDKSLYDSEDAFAVFQSMNFTDIDSLNMNDTLAGELFDRLSKRAEEKLEEEQMYEDMFKHTSRYRLHSMVRSNNSMKDTINFEESLFDESIDVEERLKLAEKLHLNAKIIDGELYVSKPKPKEYKGMLL